MKNFRYVMYSVILTVLGFGLWIAIKDYEKILSAITRIGWLGFLFTCMLSLVNYSFRFLRWKYLLKTLGDNMPFVDGLVSYISGFSLTTTPGKVGETVRCVYFKQRYGINHTHTLAAILTERASDALASLLLASAVLYTFAAYRWIGASFLLLLLGVITGVKQSHKIIPFVRRMPLSKITLMQNIMDALPILVERSAKLFSPNIIGTCVLLALVSWSAEALGFAWLSLRLGGVASPALYMSIFAIGMIAGAATFSPGGLGGAEMVLYWLLKVTGLDDASSVAITVVCRVATLWFAVMLGLLAVLWLEHHPPPVDTTA